MRFSFYLLAAVGLLWGFALVLEYPHVRSNPYDSAIMTATAAIESRSLSDDAKTLLPSKTVLEVGRFATVARKTIYYQQLTHWWSGAMIIILSGSLVIATVMQGRKKTGKGRANATASNDLNKPDIH